jgi:membrane associated rhomboid family serine protease
MPPLPPVTQALLLCNLGIYCLQVILGDWLTGLLALWPIGPNFLPFQPVTYAFLHGGWAHLFFNMLGLWMFGGDLEYKLGRNRYLSLYFASVLTAALAQLLLAPLTGSQAPTVGASGALYGLLVAFAMSDPNRIVMLMIPPIPMKARTMAIVFGLLELYLLLPPFFPGVTFLNYVFGNVAHLAHLGGMLGGFLTVRYWRRQAPFRRLRR